MTRWLSGACAVAAVGGLLLATSLLAGADAAKSGDKDKAAAKGRPEGEPVRKQLVRPKSWPAEQPLPLVGSNCAACHLTAGRELTAAVVNFARSAHDLAEMTCYDCHGGNTRDDVKAHEGEFGFIGTKKSAHIATCSECHSEEAEILAKGPHGWDFSKRINTEYPLCFDCHGNHDIGNPPADFKLTAMCGDCHENMNKQFSNLSGVVKDNDLLWEVMRKVHKQNIAQENPLPEEFRGEVEKLRNDTMKAVHAAKEIPVERANDLNKRAEQLRIRMEKWLKSKTG